jgi:hypothetical protein
MSAIPQSSSQVPDIARLKAYLLNIITRELESRQPPAKERQPFVTQLLAQA